MHYTVVGQFDNKTLLPGMEWDMMGAFVKTEAGNKYVYPWDWVLKDNQTGLFVVIKDKEYQEKYVTNKINNMSDQNLSAEAPTSERPPLTFGQKLAGVSFNPSNDPKVDTVKRLFAQIADLVDEDYSTKESGSKLDPILYQHTIGEILNAQMNCVKLLTLKY